MCYWFYGVLILSKILKIKTVLSLITYIQIIKNNVSYIAFKGIERADSLKRTSIILAVENSTNSGIVYLGIIAQN